MLRQSKQSAVGLAVVRRRSRPRAEGRAGGAARRRTRSVVPGVGMFRGEERPPARRGEGAGAAEGAGPPPPGSQPHFLGVRGDHSLPGAASGATDRPVRVHISLSLCLFCMCL